MRGMIITAAFALTLFTVWIAFNRNQSEDLPESFQPQPISPNLDHKESPMLQEMVAEGSLPPLSERLPENPIVVVPTEQPGRYGDVWRRYAIGIDDNAMGRLIYESAIRWSGDGKKIEPNLCWKYEVSEDSREFTFWLREGVRWSDGVPLTSEDVRFWWEDFTINQDINPVAPFWVQNEGELPEFEVLGPYAFRFTFSKPYGLFLERVAWLGIMWMPKHYLKEFHANYRDVNELTAEAKKAGFNAWNQLYIDKANRLLDELGLATRDPDGYRLRPNEKLLAMTVDHGATTDNAQMAEYFTQRCLKRLGIKGILKPSTGARLASGQHQIQFGEAMGRNMQLLLQPTEYIPYSHTSSWAGQYGVWYQTGGARGWTPSPGIRRVFEIYDEIQSCTVQEKRYELMGQIIDLHAENLWIISSLEGIPVPIVVSPRSGNVPKNIVASWQFYTPSNAHPEQFYLKW